jgi:hypothetical protein
MTIGWAAIDLAPKDGTSILGYSAGNGQQVTRWISTQECWEWSEPYDDYFTSWVPTHWKYLESSLIKE